MQSGPRQLIACPSDLSDLPQIRAAAAADIADGELRATNRTVLHGSCLKIEEQIGQLLDSVGEIGVILVPPTIVDGLHQIDDFAAILPDDDIKLGARSDQQRLDLRVVEGGVGAFTRRRLFVFAEQRVDALTRRSDCVAVVARYRLVDGDPTLESSRLLFGGNMQNAVAIKRQVDNDRIARRGSPRPSTRNSPISMFSKASSFSP